MRLSLFNSKPTLSDAGEVRSAVVAALKRKHGRGRVQVSQSHPSELVVNLGKGPVTCHLSNLSKAVLKAQITRQDQHSAIETFVHSLIETQEMPAPSAEDLLVGVRNQGYATSMLHVPFTGDLAVVLLQDRPASVCFLREAHLRQTPGLTPDQAWNQGYDNLTSRLNKDLDVFELGEGGFWVACGDGTVIGNSVLLAVPLLQSIREEEGAGALLISASTREGIEIYDEDAPRAVERVQAAVVRGQRAPYRQSSCVFRLAEGDQIPRPILILDDMGAFRPYAPN